MELCLYSQNPFAFLLDSVMKTDRDEDELYLTGRALTPPVDSIGTKSNKEYMME